MTKRKREETSNVSRYSQVIGEFSQSIKAHIDILDTLAKEERSATEKESCMLVEETDYPSGMNTEVVVMLLEREAEKSLRERNIHYQPFILQDDSLHDFSNLLSKLPEETSIDYCFILNSEGRHSTPIRICINDFKKYIFILDAATERRDKDTVRANWVYARILADKIGAEIYEASKYRRQFSDSGCLMFALQDLYVMSAYEPEKLREMFLADPSDVDTYVEHHPDFRSTIQSLSTLKQLQFSLDEIKPFIREVYINSETQGNRISSCNWTVIYRMKDYISAIEEKIRELERQDDAEEILEAIIENRTFSHEMKRLRAAVDQELSQTTGYALSEIEKITSDWRYSHFDAYQIKLALEFKIPLEKMKISNAEDSLEESTCCFYPNEDASEYVYMFIKKRLKRANASSAVEILDKIKRFDQNQIKLFVCLNKAKLAPEIKKLIYQKIIKGDCFKGRVMGYSLLGEMSTYNGKKYYEVLCEEFGGTYTFLDYKKVSNRAFEFISKLLVQPTQSVENDIDKVLCEIYPENMEAVIRQLEKIELEEIDRLFCEAFLEDYESEERKKEQVWENAEKSLMSCSGVLFPSKQVHTIIPSQSDNRPPSPT